MYNITLLVVLVLALLGCVNCWNNNYQEMADNEWSIDSYTAAGEQENETYKNKEEKSFWKEEEEVKDPFSVAINGCRIKKRRGVTCTFEFTNNGQHPFYLLKYFTPFTGYMADFLQVTRNGQHVEYDGYMMRYLEVKESSLLLFQPGQSKRVTIDISQGYSFAQPGEYIIRYNRPPTYFTKEDIDKGNTKDDFLKEQSDPPVVEVNEFQRRESTAVLFQERANLAFKTEGEMEREKYPMNNKNITNSNYDDSNPTAQGAIKPLLENFSDEKKKNYIIALHEAAYFYCELAKQEVNNDRLFSIWFGSQNLFNRQDYRDLYRTMKTTLERSRFTYYYGHPYGRCNGRTAGLAVKNSRKIYMCPVTFTFPQIAHPNSPLNTIIHEMTHAILSASDIVYGHKAARNLAINKPEQTKNSATNIAYLANYANPLNIGVDSAITYDSYTYMTKGPVYVRFSDANAQKIDCGYPKLIYYNWGKPSYGKLRTGFSTMLRLTGDQKIYITKGKEYWRYNDNNDDNPTGPFPIETHFSSNGLPTAFKSGFDSHFRLNTHYLATRGKRVIQYSDAASYFIDSGYPKNIAQYWPGIDEQFAKKFTSAFVLRNGKFCAFHGREHTCSSQKDGKVFDDYYPRPITNHFGEYECFYWTFSNDHPY